jgi:hypothetical protein
MRSASSTTMKSNYLDLRRLLSLGVEESGYLVISHVSLEMSRSHCILTCMFHVPLLFWMVKELVAFYVDISFWEQFSGALDSQTQRNCFTFSYP